MPFNIRVFESLLVWSLPWDHFALGDPTRGYCPGQHSSQGHRDTPTTAPLRDLPGTSDWEESLGQTQNPLEGLYISSGLGTPRDPPGGAGECYWGEGSLEDPA